METYSLRLISRYIKSISIGDNTWIRLVDLGWTEASGNGEIEIFESLDNRAEKWPENNNFFKELSNNKDSFIVSIYFRKETGLPSRITLGKLKETDQSHINDHARWRFLECDFTIRYYLDPLTGKLEKDISWDSPVIEINPRYTHLIEVIDLDSYRKLLNELFVDNRISHSVKFNDTESS
jgi:hypothetical protein